VFVLCIEKELSTQESFVTESLCTRVTAKPIQTLWSSNLTSPFARGFCTQHLRRGTRQTFRTLQYHFAFIHPNEGMRSSHRFVAPDLSLPFYSWNATREIAIIIIPKTSAPVMARGAFS
jgi:hypothetical protein